MTDLLIPDAPFGKVEERADDATSRPFCLGHNNVSKRYMHRNARTGIMELSGWGYAGSTDLPRELAWTMSLCDAPSGAGEFLVAKTLKSLGRRSKFAPGLEADYRLHGAAIDIHRALVDWARLCEIWYQGLASSSELERMAANVTNRLNIAFRKPQNLPEIRVSELLAATRKAVKARQRVEPPGKVDHRQEMSRYVLDTMGPSNPYFRSADSSHPYWRFTTRQAVNREIEVTRRRTMDPESDPAPLLHASMGQLDSVIGYQQRSTRHNYSLTAIGGEIENPDAVLLLALKKKDHSESTAAQIRRAEKLFTTLPRQVQRRFAYVAVVATDSDTNTSALYDDLLTAGSKARRLLTAIGQRRVPMVGYTPALRGKSLMTGMKDLIAQIPDVELNQDAQLPTNALFWGQFKECLENGAVVNAVSSEALLNIPSFDPSRHPVQAELVDVLRGSHADGHRVMACSGAGPGGEMAYAILVGDPSGPLNVSDTCIVPKVFGRVSPEELRDILKRDRPKLGERSLIIGGTEQNDIFGNSLQVALLQSLAPLERNGFSIRRDLFSWSGPFTRIDKAMRTAGLEPPPMSHVRFPYSPKALAEFAEEKLRRHMREGTYKRACRTELPDGRFVYVAWAKDANDFGGLSQLDGAPQDEGEIHRILWKHLTKVQRLQLMPEHLMSTREGPSSKTVHIIECVRGLPTGQLYPTPGQMRETAYAPRSAANARAEYVAALTRIDTPYPGQTPESRMHWIEMECDRLEQAIRLGEKYYKNSSEAAQLREKLKKLRAHAAALPHIEAKMGWMHRDMSRNNEIMDFDLDPDALDDLDGLEGHFALERLKHRYGVNPEDFDESCFQYIDPAMARVGDVVQDVLYGVALRQDAPEDVKAFLRGIETRVDADFLGGMRESDGRLGPIGNFYNEFITTQRLITGVFRAARDVPRGSVDPISAREQLNSLGAPGRTPLVPEVVVRAWNTPDAHAHSQR
ncbi:MAG: hypothetical protein HOQ05_07505 [Corynebacteriales bacterium]|nr:hypothetical protein [Mycobacteriales bacterium]